MTTGSRRILVTALLAALVGLGVVALLFGRRPRRRTAAEVEAPLPASAPAPLLVPSPAPRMTEVRRAAPAGRAVLAGRARLAAGFAGLLLLGGIAAGLWANRDVPPAPGVSATGRDDGQPLAARSLPEAATERAPAPNRDAPIAAPSQPDRPATAGRDFSQSPEMQARLDPKEEALRLAPDEGLSDEAETGSSKDSAIRQEPREASRPGGSEAGSRPEPTAEASAPDRDDARQDTPRGNSQETSKEIAARSEPPADPDLPASTGSLFTRAPAQTNAKPASPGPATTVIRPGDSLWAISRRLYGRGARYRLIRDANRDRIRDSNLIRPGQTLVLPRRLVSRGSSTAAR